METRRDNLISILNNDDNPSFFIRPSGSLKDSPSLSDSRPQLHIWPSPSEGSYSYSHDPPIFSPESPTTFYNHREFISSSSSSHPMTLTPSPEPTFVRSYSHSSAARSPIDPPKRMSIQSITNPYSRTSEPEPISPQSPYGHSTSSTMDAAGAQAEAAASKPVRKNKYPCPYAASHGCAATFTTSGHAARHGKKHTGEKSVLCPICNKAFTRKDNMKQHKRTHRNALAASTTATTTSRDSSQAGRWSSTKESSLGDLAGLSHSDVDTPPTPASDFSSSAVGSFALNADETARRLAQGRGRVKRHSVSSASSSRSGPRSSGGITRSSRRR